MGRELLTSNHDLVNCIMYGHNLMLQYPIEEVLDACDLRKRILMQMLHTSYTLKALHAIKTWREMQRFSTKTTSTKDMQCPALFHWEHVGEAAQYVVKYKK